MPPAFLISINTDKNYSSDSSPTLSSLIIKAARENFPVLNSLLIPPDTLEFIAQHNHLKEKLQPILKLIDFHDQNSINFHLKKIRNVIKTQQLPRDLANELLKTYYQKIEPNLALLSLDLTLDKIQYNQHLVTQGDANFVLSVLELWAAGYGEHNLHLLNQTTVPPFGIIFQTLPAAQYSGMAFSRHPDNQDKKKLLFQLYPKLSFFKNNNSKSINIVDDLLSQENSDFDSYNINTQALSQLTRKIKLLFPWPIKLNLYLDQNFNPFFSHIFPQEIEPEKNNDNLKPNCWRGTSLNPSKVMGVLESSSQVIFHPENKILLTDYCDQQQLSILHKITGLVLLEHPSSLVLSIIRKYKIPTLILNHSNLPPQKGEMYILDTHLGLLSQIKSTSSRNSSKTNKQFWLSDISHYSQTNLIDGLFLKSKSHASKAEHLLKKFHLPLIVESSIENLDQLISQPQSISQEISTLEKLSHKYNLPIIWLSGLMRSFSEWKIAQHLISDLSNCENIDYFLNVSTPETLLSLSNYQLPQIKGIAIDIKLLRQHLLGLSSSNELINYSQKSTVLLDLIKQSYQYSQQNQIQLFVLVDNANQDLIKQLLPFCDGVIGSFQKINLISV